MISVDRALALLIDEAAGIDRRPPASWLALAAEDALHQLPEAKYQLMLSRFEEKLEAMPDSNGKQIIEEQYKQLKAQWADRQKTH